MEKLKSFLRDEVSEQEMYEEIYNFITSVNIRNGEYECNYYIIKKMDLLNFIIYPEDVYPDNHREISYSISIYKDDLLKEIKNHIEKIGLKQI